MWYHPCARTRSAIESAQNDHTTVVHSILKNKECGGQGCSHFWLRTARSKFCMIFWFEMVALLRVLFWSLNYVSKHDSWDQHFGLPDPEFWRWLFPCWIVFCNCCTHMLLHVFFETSVTEIHWVFVSADHDETNGLYSVWFSVFTRFYESGNFKGPQLLGTEQTQSKKSTGFSSLVVQVGAGMNISDVFSPPASEGC